MASDPNVPLPEDLPETLGSIDVYLFDQVLRGRFPRGSRVLDVGCGGGRNLHYFLRAGIDVVGLDQAPEVAARARGLARRLDAPGPNGFAAGDLTHLPFPDHAFDRVVAIAVLHFATGPDQFQQMMDEVWRVLRPGGLFFARLATSATITDEIQPLGQGRFLLPDGTERFLVDEALLNATARRLGGELADPHKTVTVHGKRAMATWCLWRDPKPGDAAGA